MILGTQAAHPSQLCGPREASAIQMPGVGPLQMCPPWPLRVVPGGSRCVRHEGAITLGASLCPRPQVQFSHIDLVLATDS